MEKKPIRGIVGRARAAVLGSKPENFPTAFARLAGRGGISMRQVQGIKSATDYEIKGGRYKGYGAVVQMDGEHLRVMPWRPGHGGTERMAISTLLPREYREYSQDGMTLLVHKKEGGLAAELLVGAIKRHSKKRAAAIEAYKEGKLRG